MRSFMGRVGVMAVLLSVLLAGCGTTAGDDEPVGTAGAADPATLSRVGLASDEKLEVIATTSIVADVVDQVGGDLVELTRLMPLGVDPHAFEPTPRDATAVSDAHILFINGADLELFMDDIVEIAEGQTPVVSVSQGVEFLPPAEGDEHAEEEHEEDHEGDVDPHVWFDPNNVEIWVRNIRVALSSLDPENAATYEANADAYLAELAALDAWIADQVAEIPEDRRELVTDHAVFTYFVDAYGFEQVGVVIPGASTLSEPSARQLADLVERIEAFDVPAIFVSTTVNARLAEQVAEDAGVDLVRLYTGSLSPAEGPAATYLDFMRYNVEQVVTALK